MPILVEKENFVEMTDFFFLPHTQILRETKVGQCKI